MAFKKTKEIQEKVDTVTTESTECKNETLDTQALLEPVIEHIACLNRELTFLSNKVTSIRRVTNMQTNACFVLLGLIVILTLLVIIGV